MANKLTKNAIPQNVSDFRLLTRKAYETLRGLEEANRVIRGLVGWMGFKSVGIKIDLDHLDLSSLVEVGNALAVDSMSLVLTSGEEHLFIATLPPSAALPAGALQIGEVIHGAGVEVFGKFSDARTSDKNTWQHFEK